MQTYRQNIVPNYNLTLPNASGLAGILYDAGLLCESSQDKLSRFLPYQPKIALAQQGNCSLAHKAVVAQADGVAALIIYDNVPFDKDPYAGIMDIPASNLTLVVYYVDLNVGLDLLLKAQSTGPIVLGSDGISSQEAIRVILYPTTNGFPSAWEFTLIVIVVLLVLSFAISETVTRTADTEKSKEVAKDSSEGSSEDSLENLPENPPEDLPKDLPAERSLELAEEKSEVDTILSIPETREACVICLDEFSKGDTIRQLPCHHEYHCECIDPWLTIKSAACPLCKYDCSMNVPMPSQSIPPAHEEHYSFLSYFIHAI
ncbi:hypothetical protein BDF14DRAFT_1742880 [Spinellus fusiger]|nr:hypothetical protein BDF14DRAFT_1742880 [Spinellus fusiger]